MSRDELAARGWDEVDVVFVTGDAYIDHPSFAMALLGRVLEADGYRVAILSQPDWQSAAAFQSLGKPRLFFAVSAGNMDSMINHYTANKKRRAEDAYSPGGEAGKRPDRATNVYAQRCREAYSDVPVIVGGVEASLRRLAHFDYWSESIRPSILATCKADLLAFGMGEQSILEFARHLDAGADIKDLRNLRGVTYLLGRNEALPEHEGETITLPSHEEIKESKRSFAEMTRRFHHETNPHNGRRLLQAHGDRVLVINPPTLPIDEEGMDRIYDLPYTRRPHPSYRDPIPAHQMIKDSITIMRGCFGGCTFCSITMHQGRIIQSRSPKSIQEEVRQLAKDPDFKGHVSDIGGPTANMYRMRCSKPEVEKICRRQSCVHPSICKLLGTDHSDLIGIMRATRGVPGIKSVKVASGIRMDLAEKSPEYIEEIAHHHVGGHLKVAPEHSSERVLEMMKKPSCASYERFAESFTKASDKAGKEQYLVPYFIASHPGSAVEDMIELAVFLKKRGYRPRQVQDFIPAPMDVATCMYYTGLDPNTMQPVQTVKKLRDRKVQRALMQFFKPENYFTVREALETSGRKDLIGSGEHCLIPAKAPKEAMALKSKGRPLARNKKGKTVGYRPHR